MPLRVASDDSRLCTPSGARNTSAMLSPGQRPICTDSREVLANEPKYPVVVLNHVLVRSWGDCRISDLLLPLQKPPWQLPRFNE